MKIRSINITEIKLGIICLSHIILMVSCTRLQSDSSLEKKFELMSNKVRIEINSITFQLDTMTKFSWDTAIILRPYSQIDKLATELKIDLNEIGKTGIESDDTVNVLAFIEHGKLINYVKLPRTKGDFSSIEDSSIIVTKSKCTFEMTKSNQKSVSGQILIQMLRK